MNSTTHTQEHLNKQYVEPIKRWVETLVIGLNLCPFAKREMVKQRVRFWVSEAESEEALLEHLRSEMAVLDEHPNIETTLVIHPFVLTDFYEYNQFLDRCDQLLMDLDRDGVYQIASFHPDYQFGGTAPDDLENYTNRSPFAVLHLLREDSLETAIANYPDSDAIPEQNINTLEQLGTAKIKTLLENCLNGSGSDKNIG